MLFCEPIKAIPSQPAKQVPKRIDLTLGPELVQKFPLCARLEMRLPQRQQPTANDAAEDHAFLRPPTIRFLPLHNARGGVLRLTPSLLGRSCAPSKSRKESRRLHTSRNSQG